MILRSEDPSFSRLGIRDGEIVDVIQDIELSREDGRRFLEGYYRCENRGIPVIVIKGWGRGRHDRCSGHAGRCGHHSRSQ